MKCTNLFSKFLVFFAITLLSASPQSNAQTLMTLPAHSSVYTGFARGYWFVAPVSFTMTGLKVAAEAGTGTQSIQVMKIGNGGVAGFPTLGTNFTTLYYVNNAANNTILTVSIPVSAGDTIGILGQAGTALSYTPVVAPYSTTIAGSSVVLNRFIYQGAINLTQALEYSSEASGQIGRVEMYYTTSACSGQPTAGTVPATMAVCPSAAFTVTAAGATSAGSMVNQWQSRNPAGTGTWTNITGANFASYTSPGITTPTDFRYMTTCTPSGLSDTTSVLTTTINSPSMCYCIPTYTYGCSNGATLESFATSGATTNISNLNTGCASTTIGYSSYLTMVASATQSATFSTSTTLSSYAGGVKIWIDWNQDGSFDPVTELAAASTATILSGSTFTETITVPLTALPGLTRMRVRVVEGSTTYGPCDLGAYGETEDYGFNVVQVSACTNPPSAGVVAGIDSICPNIAFTLSSTGVTLASGMTYQWQSGTSATGPWSNITGASSPSYSNTAGITATAYYRLSVQCGTGTIQYSASKTVTKKSIAECYCTPTYTSGCSFGDNIKDVILLGDVTPGINNLNTPCPTSGYQDYSSTISATLTAGSTYAGNVTTGYTSPEENVNIWIDYNQNGLFDASESIDTLQNLGNTSIGAISFTVPTATAAGIYKMRVRMAWLTSPDLIDPCASISYGEAHDYKIIIQAGSTCTPPVVNLGADTTICAGQTLTLNAGAANATFTKLWSNAATTQTINVTTAGTYSVTVTNGTCVGKDTIVVGVTPSPVVNLGADTAICSGSTLTLSAGAANSTYTKLWSNLATTQTIAVTTAGTYSVKVTNGACSKSDTVVVTVNPTPVVNLGADTSICAGTSLTLNAGNAGATYLWTGGTTAQTLAVTTAGTYGVTVTKTGCMATDSIVVSVTATPSVSGITATGAAPTFVFTANGATNVTTYAWTFGDGGTSGIAAPTHTYVQTEVDQTFTVTLIVSNACGSDTVTTTVVVPRVTGVNTLQLNAKQLKLYPNPAQQLVTVENDSKLTMKQIRITNILGQEVTHIAVSNQAKQTFNVANLAAGLYNVTIEFEEGSVNRKLEILK